MTILSTLFYFIIAIGILVVVHEFGHFIAAISCGMRAEVFAVGMGNRLFGWNKKTKFSFGKLNPDLDLEGSTDYRVAMFPIGGYVKIAGMIDESMDTEFLKQEPQPWEFRSKPIWQRALVLSAGVLMNLLLAIVIFWGITYYQGKTIRPTTEIGYITPNSPAVNAGLHVGDKFLSINNHPIHHWDEIETTLYTESVTKDLSLHLQRSGEPLDISIRKNDVPDISEERFGVFPIGLVAVVVTVEARKPAEHIGLQSGDTILAVNGQTVGYGSLQDAVKAHAGKEISLSWKRGSQLMNAFVTPTSEGRIGISLEIAYRGPIVQEHYSFFEALPISLQELKFTGTLILSNIHQLVAGKASLSKSVGGPIKIAQMAKRSADAGLADFFGLIALLSLSLALLNILPFPALDGGHLAFLAYEAVFRREVPVRVKIIIQQAGFVLLLVFIAFILYNDVINF
jgi:regulator of sigma E protease